MKHFYSLFFLAAVSLLPAQTLTQSFNEPVVGDINKQFRLDTSLYTSGMPVNTTGSVAVWDYSRLITTFPMVVDSFVAPGSAPSHTAFPSATFVQHRDDIYTYYASNTTSQQTELLGGYSPSLSLTFTNTAIIAGYPVSYGYNLTDPVSGSFKYNSSNGACNGNITISANGSGTLNFPNNVSITNVLCLKSVEILTLSAGIFPFGTFNQTIYNYYMPGKKYPVLNVNYTTYQFISGTPTITAFVYGNIDYFSVTGIASQALNAADYRVFPNPFSDGLTIDARYVLDGTVFTLYSADGHVIFETRDPAGEPTVQLAAGMYVLEAKNKQGVVRQKVIKQ